MPCTEEQHQMNRRTEFIIVRFDSKYDAQPIRGVQSDREYDAQNVRDRMKSKDEFFPDQNIINQSNVIIDFDKLTKGWYIVAESLNNIAFAVDAVQKYQKKGFANAFVIKSSENGKEIFRVVVKSFSTSEAANNELDVVKRSLKNDKIWVLKK